MSRQFDGPGGFGSIPEDATHHVSPELWRRYLRRLIDGLATRRDGPGDLGPVTLDRKQLVDALCAAARPARRP
jgi:hypothetical protein